MTKERKVTMSCPLCEIRCASFGKHRNGLRRFRCGQCGKTYTEAHENILGDMTIPEEKALLALRMLLEGCSIRSVERTTELHRDTILKLLVLAGEKCERIMGKLIVNVPVKDVECDEIWGFVQKEEGHKKPAEANDYTIGDQYCFVAIERNSKLILNFALGRRDKATTDIFIEGLRHATAHQSFQVTTDGFPAYANSIPDTLGDRVTFAQLIKVYKAGSEGEARYSPAEVASVEVVRVLGQPNPELICTSIVERQNLTIRMQMRRLTRLTNGFSKKWDNLWSAYCLHFAYYNFCWIHRSIRVTPAMEAGIAAHPWSIRELLSTQL